MRRPKPLMPLRSALNSVSARSSKSFSITPALFTLTMIARSRTGDRKRIIAADARFVKLFFIDSSQLRSVTRCVSASRRTSLLQRSCHHRRVRKALEILGFGDPSERVCSPELTSELVVAAKHLSRGSHGPSFVGFSSCRPELTTLRWEADRGLQIWDQKKHPSFLECFLVTFRTTLLTQNSKDALLDTAFLHPCLPVKSRRCRSLTFLVSYKESVENPVPAPHSRERRCSRAASMLP